MFNIENLKKQISQNSWFGDLSFTEIYGYNCIEIPSNKIVEICSALKINLHFDQLIDIAGVDRFTAQHRFELIYNLWSNSDKSRLFLRTKLDLKHPEIESVIKIWKGADWMEREAYDMFGIVFRNHPDLRRIYMMEEFEYYPLRKDYPLMGIPGAVELPKK